MPLVFQSVYSTSILFARLRSTPAARSGTRRTTTCRSRTGGGTRCTERVRARRALAKLVVESGPEIEAALGSLRAWRPSPLLPAKPSAFSDVYDKLAKVYEDRAKVVTIGSAPPGPFDD